MSTNNPYRDDHSDFLKGEMNDFLENPLLMFQKWYQLAHEKNCASPHAMSISTVDKNGQPSCRMVYLKEILEEGFVFYTNYDSRKGNHLSFNNKIAALFFWQETEQQIRIEGEVEKVEDAMSDDYFQSRPRVSKIGAWASQQSKEIKDRLELEDRVKYFEEKYPDFVPRPPHWGGFIIKPMYIEFWQGRLGRLHDRICYTKMDETNWKITRIAP